VNKLIQSGKTKVSIYEDQFNKRIRVDDYDGDHSEIVTIIKQETDDWVEKVIVKSRPEDLSLFLSQGFKEEAHVKGYFLGKDMHFVVKYLSAERGISKKWNEEESIVTLILGSVIKVRGEVPGVIEFASITDAAELAELYGTVFKIYPTPLSDVNYLKKTIEEGTVYAFIRESGKIVSAASAEINLQFQNAEMTDCASLTQAEGKGYMKKLISVLEKQLKKDNINCLYTIARAESYSMNKVFYQLGYTYSGRMVNNCYVYSGIEDMNVWYKIVPCSEF
jgi:beta-lysine N6-acetyltransferase